MPVAPAPAAAPALAPATFTGRAKRAAKETVHSIITWQWSKKLVHWVIMSAGTMSELAFLAASIWMSLNVNIHPFLTQTLHMSEDLTVNLTYLSTTAYVALPECIVGLAVVVTISHIRTWLYTREKLPAVWVFLYGLPTLVFVVLSLVTLSEAVYVSSLGQKVFDMPGILIVARADAGYMFAFTSLIYSQLGEKQEKDRLLEKDFSIAEKAGEVTRLTNLLASETARLENLIEEQKQVISQSKKQNDALVNEVKKAAEDGLQAYSDECKIWLMGGAKTVYVDTVTEFTRHSKRKINSAIAAGNLQVSSRNKELILVSSLVEWLKKNPPTAEIREQETGPILQIVNRQ